MKPSHPLRNGYTTGSAATAAAVAAFRRQSDPVTLQLPGGGKLTVPIFRIGPGQAVVIKDGGDDPDVTTGSEIHVSLHPYDGPPEPADYVEQEAGLELVIRGGDGVGRVTRPGLAVAIGKTAINPVPRRMLRQNLAAAGCSGRYLVTITIPGGREVAARPMNPTLGIVDGISILGHSGIVRPYSHAAYAATIVLQLRSCAAAGEPVAALATGNRSAMAIARDFPQLPETSLIRIADFIHVAVTAARTANLPRLLLGCMPGKLFKYACGEKNTHARYSRIALSRLRDFGLTLPGIALENLSSMGELAAALSRETYMAVLDRVYEQAQHVLQAWAGNTTVQIILYDEAGRRLK
ncbi:MAG: cobalt-precorrin-5B (C(1))-methyltransferase CbiD [Victivallales bacterium]|nr:cobalt-precorrin-5B (C(1))-methyltransferase CbiD [Victivallales bacterium]